MFLPLHRSQARPSHRYARHRHHLRVLFTVSVNDEQQFGIILEPGKRVRIMTKVTVGHKLTCSIGFLDTNGNPMLTAPTPDAPPGWSNTTPASETLVPAADGLTAVATTVAAGTDTINLTVVVGGVSFAAALSVEVDAAPQVLGSVVINAVAS